MNHLYDVFMEGTLYSVQHSGLIFVAVKYERNLPWVGAGWRARQCWSGK